MTAWLLDRFPDARITASDTDPEAMAWVREHLPVAAAVTLPRRPPAPLPDDGFDLVVGHSVLSHLVRDAQVAWLEELARVCRRDALAALSFNGPLSLGWHLDHPLADVPASVGETVAREGLAEWHDDGWDATFHADYRTVFVSHAYIHRTWTRWFEVVDLVEGGAPPWQDIAVLRAR